MTDLVHRIRERLAAALGANQPASRVAAAWAVGVGIGLSPALGLHTALALAVALAFRLNKVDVLLGTLIVNPDAAIQYPAFQVPRFDSKETIRLTGLLLGGTLIFIVGLIDDWKELTLRSGRVRAFFTPHDLPD